MASSGNFCTLNPLPYSTNFRNGGLGKGNLYSNPGNNCMGFGTMALTSGKKWYMEGIAQNAYNTTMGIFEINDANTIQNSLNTFYYNNTSYKSAFYHRDGTKYIDGSNSSYGATFAIGDVIGMAVDLQSGTNTITFYKNNASQGSFNLGTNGLDYLFCMARGTSGGGWYMNFGQDSTFGGNKTAGGNADANGFGDFFYAVPSSHLAVCSANLGISSDIDPAQTDDDYPAKNFNVVTYTGNSSTNAVTGLNLQPDLLWVKKRSATGTNYLSDTSRGINKFMFSNGTDAEQTGGGYASIYSAFGTDGFTLGSSATGPNDSGATYVAWGWRANGGVTSSNTNGSITSTVQANTKGGFSIITYTGTGSNATIGHGLSSAPEFIIVKNRSQADAWAVYHVSNGATKYLTLNDGSKAQTSSAFWNDTTPTTTVISIGNDHRVNASSENYVCYAWHSVAGYSSFGTYTGNGNADGPFIYTNGTRPRMVFTKNASYSGTRRWVVTDTARSTFNVNDDIFWWDEDYAETVNSARSRDTLSNGFKIRGVDSDHNTSGNTYVYGCFGDVPFKYNNTF